MLSKYYSAVLCVFLSSFHIHDIVCDKSLTFIINTTPSMSEEIGEIQAGLPSFLNAIHPYVKDYIVVRFKDTDVGPITITANLEEFKEYIQGMSGDGGSECPDNSLEALQRALEVSRPRSYLFLFTDTDAVDHNNVDVINFLCQRTASQIIIFLTGSCARCGSTSIPNNISLYRDITKSCSGKLIRSNTLRDAFRLMEESIKWDQKDNASPDVTPCDCNTTTTAANILPSTTVTVAKPVTQKPTMMSNEVGDDNGGGIFNIFRSHKVNDVLPGKKSNQEQTKKTNSRTDVLAKINIEPKKNDSFLVGFSYWKPTTIKETAKQPLPNRNNYILIAPLDNENFKPTAVKISSHQEDNCRNTSMALQETRFGSGIYVSSDSFYVSERVYTIVVTGTDSKGNTVTKVSPEIEVQHHMDPYDSVKHPAEKSPKLVAEIIVLDPEDVEYGGNVTIACKVAGQPRPAIWWMDSHNLSPRSQSFALEYPDVFISYVTITNITTNGIYFCKTNYMQRTHEDVTKSIDIRVKLTNKFEMIDPPEDQYIDVETEGRLNCKAEVFPEPTVNWYHNGSRITSYEDNYKIHQDTLVIKNMGLDDVGNYTCEIKNSFETRHFEAAISISGLEAPVVTIQDADIAIKIKTGDKLDLFCSAQGKPSPVVTWKYKRDEEHEFQNLYFDIKAEGGILNVDEIKSHHKGIYRCEAQNIAGNNYQDIEVNIESPPVIEQDDVRTIVVKERQEVALNCKVDSDSVAKVHWEMSLNGVVEAFDGRHETDEHNTHRFFAIWKDSGDYHCIAENDAGKTEKIITVDVLVTPYIQEPNPGDKEVRVGGDITLPCVIQYGNPTPKVHWEFKPTSSVRTISLSANEDNALVLTRVSKSHTGQYSCVADNYVGSDNIKINLQVI